MVGLEGAAKLGLGERKGGKEKDVWGVKESGREGNRREGSMRAMISRCVRLTGPRTALKLLLIYPIRRKDEKEAVNINCPIFLRFVRKRERERMYASTHARATFLLHLHLVTSRDANESENERKFENSCAWLYATVASHIFSNLLCITRMYEYSIANFVYNNEIIDRCILL